MAATATAASTSREVVGAGGGGVSPAGVGAEKA